MILANSNSIRGCTSSGPQDLFTFILDRCNLTISSVTRNSDMTEFVLFVIVGIVPSGSLVNTDENCFCKMFALSSSVNLRESLSFISASSGATLHLVFSFLLQWDQNAFGLLIDRWAIPISNIRLDFLSNFFDLFLAFMYTARAASIWKHVLAAIQARYKKNLQNLEKLKKNWNPNFGPEVARQD